MKILVIDDEQSFATLLGRALRRLGHSPVIAVDPRDALDLLPDGFDAVITDIDMPVIDGLSLARTIRERHDELPVAFCTGSTPSRLAEAKKLGRVLPKTWTVADVRALVEDLQRERAQLRRVPRASYPKIPTSLLPRPGLTGREVTPRPEPVEDAPRPRIRKVKLNLSDWRRVEGLCKTSAEGPVFIAVRGPGDAAPGDPLSVALALPDEITVSVAGEVQALRPGGDAAEAELIVELTGLTSELAARLASLASPSKEALVGHYFDARRPHACAWNGGTGGNDLADDGDPDGDVSGRRGRVSELLRDNREIRGQIDALSRRLRRKL